MTRFLDSRYEQWPAWPLYLQKPGHENHTSSMPAVTQYGCACICLLRRYAGRGDHSISYTSAKWSRVDTCSDEALVRFSEVKRLWIEFIWVHATCLASLPVFHAYVWLNVCVFLFSSCVASQKTSHLSHSGPRSLLNQPERCHPTMDLDLRKIRCAPVRVCCLNLHRRISRSLWKKTGKQWS